MNKADLVWIKSMEWCAKYWGCHQMPERSFFIFGYQFPVCARCTGIIFGEIFALIGAIFFLPRFCLCIILMVPMLIDGIIQYKTKYLSNNIKRVCTGFLFGYGFISAFLSVIHCFMKNFISV